MRRRARVSAVVMMVASAVGCSDDDVKDVLRAQLSQGCAVNTDCQDPLVCAFRLCHQACTEQRDCPTGYLCVESDRPYHVCQLRKGCALNSECFGTQVCARDGVCRDECYSDKDCVRGLVCADSACATPEELIKGRLPARDGGVDGSPGGDPCHYNSDCSEPFICRDNSCAYECKATSDCPTGLMCIMPEHRCKTAEVPDAGTDVSVSDADAGSDVASDQVGDPVAEPEVDVSVEAGQPCVYSSECASPLVCRQGECRFECQQDADCLPSEHCDLADAGGTYRCLPDLPPCTYSTDCTSIDPALLCIGGICRYECTSVADCPVGKKCFQHRCQIDVPDGAPAGYGATCSYTPDCAPGLVCGKAGMCVYECLVDYDCLSIYGKSFCCSQNNTCVSKGFFQCPSEDAGVADTGSADAPLEAGAPCTKDMDCVDNLFCNGYEHCVAGHCELSPKKPCDDSNPCTADSCDEPTKTCTNQPSGPVDADGDGHYAASCGGPADDCDDQNAKVYPGHGEECDGVDNNCNGEIDEGMWKITSTAVLPKTFDGGALTFDPKPSANDSSYYSAPVIVRRTDGTFWVGATPSTFSELVFVWRVDSGLTSLEGPLGLQAIPGPTTQGPYNRTPFLATEGVGFFFSSEQNAWNAGASSGHGQWFVTPSSLSQVGARKWSKLGNGGPTRAAAAWNGSSYSVVWGDPFDGATRVYVSTVSTSNVLGSVKPVVADGVENQYETGSTWDNVLPMLAIGSSNSIVVWPVTGSPPGAQRWVLYDKTLTSVLGPTHYLAGSTGSPTRYLTGIAHVGSTYALSFMDTSQDEVTVKRLNESTGEILGSTTVSNSPNGPSDPKIARLGSGFLLTMAAGPSIRFAWAPESMPTGFAMQQHFTAAQVSGINVAAIDDKNAVLVWQSAGSVTVGKLTCGP